MDQATANAQVARFLTSWDPHDLWPGVSAAAFAAAAAAIEEATRTLLTSPDARADLDLPAGVDARVLGIAASTAGMGPLLGFWIEAGRLHARPELADLFATHLDHGRRRAARLSAILSDLLVRFDEAGIDATLLKGLHHAHVYFPDPGARPMSDIDVLVDGHDLARAADVLESMGLARSTVSPHATTWSSVDPVVSIELTHADNPWSVDLHPTLDRVLGSIRRTKLGFSRERDTTRLSLAGRSVRVLRPPLHTWYACVHVSAHLERLPLVRLVDLLLVLRRDGDEGSWSALLERLDGSGEHATLYPALALAERWIGGCVPARVLERIAEETPKRIRRRVARSDPARTHILLPTSWDTQLMWAESPPARLRWMLARLWPRDRGLPARPGRAAISTIHRIRRLLRGRMRFRA